MFNKSFTYENFESTLHQFFQYFASADWNVFNIFQFHLK
jgi:hypothetical protein